MRVDIRLGYACQNQCRFCPQGDWRQSWPVAASEQLKDRIRAAREQGNHLVLSGGEPTLHPELEELVAFARGLGFREIELQTNGRKLSSPAFVQRLAAAGVSIVSPALHGDSPELHDALTRAPGSFGETAEGIRSLRAAGVHVVVHTLLLRPNLAGLPRLARLCAKLGANALHLGLVNPVGDVEHAFDELVPRLSALPPVLDRVVATAARLGLPLSLDGIPPCVAGEHARLLCGPEGSTWVQDLLDGSARPLAQSSRRCHGPPCEGCAARRECPGVFSLYAARVGFDELTTLPRFDGELGAAVGAPRSDRPASEVLFRRLDLITERDAHTVGVELDEAARAVSVVMRTTCNNRCDFCTTRIMHEETSTPWTAVDGVAPVLSAVERFRKDGARRVVFVAMEPLEHPGISEIVRGCRELGYAEVELWSNARRFSEPSFAAELIRAGLTDLRVPFFGAAADVHDAVTSSAGSFAEAVQGIAQVRSAGLPRDHVRLAYILVRKNHHQLLDFLELAEASDLGTVTDYDVAAPSSHDLRFYEPIALRFDDVAHALATRIRSAAPRYGAFVLARLSRWLPPCVAMRHFGPEIEASYRERRSGKNLAIRMIDPASGAEAGEGRGRDKKLRVACEKRDACAAGAVCPGYFAEYARLYGIDELEPMGLPVRQA